ncbi:MAG TPA: hypothetical protein ENN20_06990 [Candidatus Marinimicrobia bacterium]|nr:hypothetical protein [Candidatus Neomarinimicrobiota bacterium]
MLPMAGLWSQVSDYQGNSVYTYTVITSAASQNLEFIHPRMPAVLQSDQLDIWLHCDRNRLSEALKILKPYSGELEAYPVSAYVNNVQNNSPRCIEPDRAAPVNLFQ